ncbi:class I SAM-dependent methyltransferase [Cyclobacterium sp.]|uniref:class I SAM-dependent methyltransferase n=1 Tax=Cyclobacterium sp. TaxID=1966343 RepID=UPI0019CACC2B|nr:class I SAM-dependent methyltransferase [Cyclobacterium sp.]MBD3628407.1 class I SAM-dependent methyltransferase [Cyclobacterium sp.]
MASPDHYRLLAPFYESLSRLLLGNQFQASKTAFLHTIEKGDQVLVVGGGAGANMPELLRRCGEKGKVVYMEASASMMRQCRKGLDRDLLRQVVFIHASAFDALPDLKFDVVITQYFLDVLPDEQIDRLFGALQSKVGKHTRWIFADFYPLSSKMVQLKAMINTFRLLTRHARKDLPEYEGYFYKWGWQEMESMIYCQGFYQARIYGFAPNSINPEISS